MPCTDSAAALADLRRREADAGQLFACRLDVADRGEFLSAARELAPGFYRLSLPLAVAPFSDRGLADLQVDLQFGPQLEQQRQITRFDLADDDVFTDAGAEIAVQRRDVYRLRLSWQIGKRGRLARVQALPSPRVTDSMTAADKDLLGGLGLEESERDGPVSTAKARELPVRLTALAPVLTLLSPVGILDLRADRLLYAPGTEGVLTATIFNGGPATSVQLEAQLVGELADSRQLPSVRLSLPAGATETVDFPFTADAKWGNEARVTLVAGDQRLERSVYFGCHENFWAVGIGHVGGASAHTMLGHHRQLPGEMRRLYANILEVFFWAPDDWCRMTPPAENWWSGQTSYPENGANLRELIELLHSDGIKVTSYGKSIAGGPFGWEMARRRPDWFRRGDSGAIAGRYDVEQLEHWNDPAYRAALEARSTPFPWYQLTPDTRVPEVLDYGADEIVRSVQYFGWDGVRFDGHYTVAGNDAWSAANMRRLRQRIAAVIPGFHFGFNYGFTPAYHGGMTAEMEQALAGGGMYMNEAIGSWHYTTKSYHSWQHYATNELRAAQQIQAAGGHYHCIYGMGGQDVNWERDFYKLVYGLAAGGHPTYGYGGAPGAGPEGWGAFMTRWSGLLWDPAMIRLADADSRFTVGTDRVWWQPFVACRILDRNRALYIQHLLVPSPDDRIAESRLPAGPAPFDVSFELAADEELERAVVVHPQRLRADALAVHAEGRQLHAEIDGLQRWAVVAWQVRGDFRVPERPTWPTPEPPAVVKAPRPAPTVGMPDHFVHHFNHGSANLWISLTPDPEAETGTAQCRPTAEKSIQFGSWWIGPRTPGRYRIRCRFKWLDPQPVPVPQIVRLALYDELDQFKTAQLALTLVTPGYENAPEGAVVLRDRGRYLEYELGEFEKKFETLFTIIGSAETPETGEHSIYFDRMTFDLIERYDDARVASWGQHLLLPRPADLRTPTGDQPARVLVVRGMFWQPYFAGLAAVAETAYAAPASYAALYDYDCVVLCNIDMLWAAFPQRKLYRDFVQDGGHLIVLGGPSTLGQGGFVGTFLDQVMPVDCRGFNEVMPCRPPARLSLAGSETVAGGYVFWRHQVKLRPGATVLAMAGEEPIAATGTFGKGRCTVFAGTTLGEGANEHQAFWESAAWVALYRRMTAAE